jgi:hypothetical protein
MVSFSAVFFFNFAHQNPGSGSGSALAYNAGFGSALKPTRIRNTVSNNYVYEDRHFVNGQTTATF